MIESAIIPAVLRGWFAVAFQVKHGQNQNILLVKRQNDNLTRSFDFHRVIPDIILRPK